MNKDNKKLTELYHLIQEGFEPDTSPDYIDGPAKELLEWFQNKLDSFFYGNYIKRVTKFSQPLYEEFYLKIRAGLSKEFGKTIEKIRGYWHKGDYGVRSDNDIQEREEQMDDAWCEIRYALATNTKKVRETLETPHENDILNDIYVYVFRPIERPKELHKYLSDR